MIEKHKDCIKILNSEVSVSCLDIELLNQNELHIDYSGCRCGAFNTIIKINYCPICGESLSTNIGDK